MFWTLKWVFRERAGESLIRTSFSILTQPWGEPWLLQTFDQYFLQTLLLFINYKFVYRFKIKNVNFRYSQWFCKLCKNLTAVTWLVSNWCQWCEYLILLKLCQIYEIDPAAMQRLELVNWAVNMCQRVQVPEKGRIFTLQQKDRKFKRKF